MNKKKSPEELSRIRSLAGKKGADSLKKSGNYRGGRKKGWTKDPSLKAIPMRSVGLREPDYKVFVRLAGFKGCPLVELMHIVAEALRAKNPKIFDTPDPKI